MNTSLVRLSLLFFLACSACHQAGVTTFLPDEAKSRTDARGFYRDFGEHTYFWLSATRGLLRSVVVTDKAVDTVIVFRVRQGALPQPRSEDIEGYVFVLPGGHVSHSGVLRETTLRIRNEGVAIRISGVARVAQVRSEPIGEAIVEGRVQLDEIQAIPDEGVSRFILQPRFVEWQPELGSWRAELGQGGLRP